MSDEQAIKNTIQTYFESMFESSGEKAHAAFHPNVKINGELHEMSVADFAGFVESQQPSPKEKGESARLDIVSLDIAGKTAVSRVRDDYLGMTFLDTLSLLKTDDQWRIYNKLFHVENSSS